MNFVAKALISLIVASSILLLKPMKSDAQVNIKLLAQVAKSCQRDALSPEYYQKMGIDIRKQHYFGNQKAFLTPCIRSRYHYSSVLTKFPWMASKGEMLPQYPGYIAIAATAFNIAEETKTNILDCIASENASSQDCQQIKFDNIILDIPIKKIDIGSVDDRYNYLLYVCPSCVISHDNIFSREAIVSAFIQWFLKLEKSNRREIVSLLGDDDEAYELRNALGYESRLAVNKYWEVRQQVQQQEQERRRRELLGQ